VRQKYLFSAAVIGPGARLFNASQAKASRDTGGTMLTLTEEQRFNAMIQIASSALVATAARQSNPYASVANEAEAYLKAILDRTNNPAVEFGSFQPSRPPMP
jgi:predicted nucleotide-binding protein (sugar kinase/HSP70/actin superfamily)